MKRAAKSVWQVQHAKTHLSEVMDRAEEVGAQIITRHGEERVAVVSIQEYRTLKARKPSLLELLMNGPKLTDEEVDLINRRQTDVGRPVEFPE